MSRARVAVFIDGLNVMFRLRELGWEEFFDVCYFAGKVARSRDLTSVHYYRTKPSIPPIKTQEQYWAEIAHVARIESDLRTQHG